MTSSELVRLGKCDDAIDLVSKQILEHPGAKQSLYFRERAHLYLFAERPRLARADFDQTVELQTHSGRQRPGQIQSDNEFNAIGVTYWAEGHEQLAASFWRFTTEALLASQVAYSQKGLGIAAGQMLWLSSVHLNSPDDTHRTYAFHEKMRQRQSSSTDSKSWPAPLVQFFFQEITEQELLLHADRTNRKCQAELALAIRAKETGNQKTYREHILKAADVTNDPYECYNCFEYYLARFERRKLS